ncbi:MAG: hypothetical protein F6K47_29500 [Symploca sp. SIO2E6]|nr:hypothetical protein [Symploca sp. SIO2E6]
MECLLNLWKERYNPDLSALYLATDNSLSRSNLLKLTSPEGRATTINKLHRRLLEISCQIAEIKTKSFYADMPNIVELWKTKGVTQVVLKVYLKLLEIYQRTSPNISPVLHLAGEHIESRSLASWTTLAKQALGMPPIEELVRELEPMLLTFQKQHIEVQDRHTLVFITTLLNFTNQLLLQKLTPLEQVLLKPYFKFVEEQVAYPWQRVCAAVAKYPVNSAMFRIVEKMFPAAAEIAETVYSKLVKLLPNHTSHRGELTEPGIIHSCIRDLQIFQAYFWLCLLEVSLVPVEEELVELSAIVLPTVGVKWKMIELWNQLLVEEISSRATPTQRILLQPYTKWWQQAFLKKRELFFVPAKYHHHQTSPNLEAQSLSSQRKWLYEQSITLEKQGSRE